MRPLTIACVALLGMSAGALAQTATPTGARPGHVPGVGTSLPLSNAASNIAPSDTRSDIAPTLPDPDVADGSGPKAYLRAARTALAAGQTGKAQESLEMAETRLLDRSVAPSKAGEPSANPTALTIRDARAALAAGDRARTLALIDTALGG